VSLDTDLDVRPGPAQAAPPRCLSRRIGFLLARGHIDCVAMAAEVLEPGLGGKHFGCMATIANEGPLSQQKLGDRLRVDRTTIVALVDELERRGLVARQRSEEDRRRSVVRLTPAGEETLAKADELARSIEDSLFGDLPADARDRLNQTLRAGLTRSAAD
jgi:DNA-binding MarR family transcriptional regulator